MASLIAEPGRPGSRHWVWIVGALALFEIGLLVAYLLRPAPVSIEVELASPHEECLARGIAQFEERRQWPTTTDGRDSRVVVEARCTLDPLGFQPPARGASAPLDFT